MLWNWAWRLNAGKAMELGSTFGNQMAVSPPGGWLLDTQFVQQSDEQHLLWSQTHWDSSPRSAISSCVTLRKLLNLSGPQSSPNDSTRLKKLSGGLTEITKCDLLSKHPLLFIHSIHHSLLNIYIHVYTHTRTYLMNSCLCSTFAPWEKDPPLFFLSSQDRAQARSGTQCKLSGWNKALSKQVLGRRSVFSLSLPHAAYGISVSQGFTGRIQGSCTLSGTPKLRTIYYCHERPARPQAAEVRRGRMREEKSPSITPNPLPGEATPHSTLTLPPVH